MRVLTMVSLLIVDDSAEIRRMLRAVVAGVADRIYECSEGGEAFLVYAAHRPDWVLMDLAMTPMDGITATELILKTFPVARIVILTQYDDVFLRNAAEQAGACGYVLKDNLFEVRRFLEPPP